MIIRKCDRCDKQIHNNYWKIKIFEKEDNTGRNTAIGVANNMEENSRTMFGKEKEYCADCIKEIKGYINNTKEREVK